MDYQVNSRFIKYLTLICLFDRGIINRATFDNVVSHNYKDLKGIYY